MTEFKMPSLGADMEAGTLVQWLKQPGDALTRGDIIAVVDTDKGAIEIEVFQDAVLERTVVQPGQKVPVGTVLAILRDPGEPTAPPGAAVAAPAAPAAAMIPVSTPTPLAATPPAERGSAMRAAIAAAMSRSKREIPHLYLASTADMSRPLAWLASENAKRSVETRVLPVALVLKAVARAAVEIPDVNGFWIDSSFRKGSGVHVGCAVALRDGGLVAPALHDVDRKDLDTVMRELRDLIARARTGGLRSSELADATITVTNLGDLGVEAAFGIIYPPQVALVACGRVVRRPWVVDTSRIEARPVMTTSISADHRAVDGRRAGQFLGALERWLQQPEAL